MAAPVFQHTVRSPALFAGVGVHTGVYTRVAVRAAGPDTGIIFVRTDVAGQDNIVPARGEAVSFPFADAMRCPIHVDDIAEVFARVLLTDKPKHAVYSSGGHAISMGEVADIVRGFLPDARISFEKQTGGRASSGNWMIDNTRLVGEFSMQYRPYRERVLQIINECRADMGQAPLKG